MPTSPRTTSWKNIKTMVDQAARIEVVLVDLCWEYRGELFIALWAHETLGHLGGDATYR